jgi:5-methylcytosine-specific restriction endonuclease McrA
LKRKPRKAKRGITLRELKALSRAIVFKRDGYKCVVCGKGKADGVQLQWSHIVSQKEPRTRFMTENIVVHCAKHHFAWHQNPIKWVPWWIEKYPERFARVNSWLAIEAIGTKAEWKAYLLGQTK